MSRILVRGRDELVINMEVFIDKLIHKRMIYFSPISYIMLTRREVANIERILVTLYNNHLSCVEYGMEDKGITMISLRNSANMGGKAVGTACNRITPYLLDFRGTMHLFIKRKYRINRFGIACVQELLRIAENEKKIKEGSNVSRNNKPNT